jgi:hypothetical protein
MKTEQDWLNYLTQPENLPCALEVGSRYKALKHAVLNNLYGRIVAKVQAHLERRKATKYWYAYHDDAVEDWASVKIWPENYPDGCGCAYVRLERCMFQKQPRFVLGIGNHVISAFNKQSLHALIASMEGHDFCLKNKAWVRRRWLEYYPEDHDFCVEAMMTNRIEDNLTEAVIEVFDEFRELMEEMNRVEKGRFKPRKM